MSLITGADIPARTVFEPRLDFRNEKFVPVVTGGSQVQQIKLGASTVSASQVSWNTAVNSGSVLGRRMYIQAQYTVSITGAPGAGNQLITPGQFCARAFPLHSATDNINIMINGETFSTSNYQQTLPTLLQMNKSWLWKYSDSTPCQLDNADRYTSVAYGNSLSSVFGTWSNVDLDGKCPRGAAIPYVLTNPTAVGNENITATIVFTTTEPIISEPFQWAGDAGEGLVGVTNMQITYSLSSDAARIITISGAGGNVYPYAGTTTVVLNNAYLFYDQINPKASHPIPSTIMQNYQRTQAWISNPVTINSGSSATLNSLGNITVSATPSYIVAFARKSDVTVSDGFSYGSILQANVMYDNKPFLSTASQQQLYQLSKANGLQMAWRDWSAPDNFSTGSILVMNPAVDFGLSDDDAPGCAAAPRTLTMQISVANNSGTNHNYELVILAVYDGYFMMVGDRVIRSDAKLTPADVIRAASLPALTADVATPLVGGWFSFSGIKDWFKDKALPAVSGFVGKVSDLAGKASDLASKASDFGRTVQSYSGLAHNVLGQALGKGMTAAGMTGAAYESRGGLARRLRG